MLSSFAILIVCFTIAPCSMGIDTLDLTQDFLQNTLDSLNEVDQNQYENKNENENASGNVVIKTFKSAIKTLIEESQNSVRELEFIDKMDKNQSINEIRNVTFGTWNSTIGNWNSTIGNWNYTGSWNYSGNWNWNPTIGNRTLTRLFEAVFDDSDYSMFESVFDDNDYSIFEKIFDDSDYSFLSEAIPKIDELIVGPFVPLFAVGLTLVMVMSVLPILMLSSMMIFIPMLLMFAIPLLMIGSIFFVPLMLTLEDI